MPEKEIQMIHSKKNNIEYDKVFFDEDVQNICKFYGCHKGMNIKNFNQRISAIQSLVNILEIFSYRKDLSESKTINKMHDISHLIYTSYSDIFITDDKKLNTKAKAIFSYLNFKAEVLLSKQFIEQFS